MVYKNIVLVGAGGMGKDALSQLIETNEAEKNYNILGFIDDTPQLQGKYINGYPVLGTTEWLVNRDEEICAVICIGCSAARKELYNRLKINPLISFPTIIAKNVRRSEYVKIGRGCIICVSSVLMVNAVIGDFVIVNINSIVGHDSVLEDFSSLYLSVNVSGNVHIKSCAEIGTGTSIIPRRTIGENAIVGAGSVVVKDIPPNCTAVGVPAAPIKFHSGILHAHN